MELTTIVGEAIEAEAKTWSDISEFLCRKIRNGAIELYDVIIDKRETIKDDENETIIRIIKGATLEHKILDCTYLPSDNYFLEDPNTGTKYNMHLHSHSTTSDYEPVETKYGCLDIERLEKFNAKEIDRNCSRIIVPAHMINCRLSYTWHHDEKSTESGIVHEKKGRLEIEGEMDKIITMLYEFLRNN